MRKFSINTVGIGLILLSVLTIYMYQSDVSASPVSPDRYKVAILQVDSKLFNKESNVNRLLAMAEEAAKNGAKLIVMGELATTGYVYYSHDEIKPLAESIPGPMTDKFASIARKHGVYIVVSMIEIEGMNYYNSAVLIGKDGNIVGKARKTHPFRQDTFWATDGDLGIPVFQTDIGNIGMIICRDSMLIEPTRVAALRGADVVAIPYATAGGAYGMFALQARSFENHIYILGANLVGIQNGTMEKPTEFPGLSVIAGPGGEIVASAGGQEEILYGSVDIARARNKKINDINDVFADRMPTTYGRIQVRVFPPQHDKRFDFPKAMEVTVASIQMEPKFGDKSTNLSKIEVMIDEAYAKASALGKQLHLPVLPEMVTTGCIFTDKKEAQLVAETIPGPSTERIGAKAKKYGIYVVFGIPEASGTLVFNTAVMIGPDGNVVGKYRKIHLWKTDLKWATLGDIEYPVFNTNIGRIGLLLSYDLMFPEPARIEAIDKADIIAVPASWDGTADFIWNIRARENQVWFVVANRYGTERGVTFNGMSAVHDYDLFRKTSYPWNDPPMKQAGPDGDNILIETLNTALPRDKWGSGAIYGQRKPDLYRIIISPSPKKQFVTHEVNIVYEELQQKYLALQSAVAPWSVGSESQATTQSHRAAKDPRIQH